MVNEMKNRMVLPIDIQIDYLFRKPNKPNSLKKSEHFHRNKKKIPRTIVEKMDKHEIIYGARALNKRFPPFLDRPTQDYDIFTPHPRRDARETERALDKKFGGDFFYIEPAIHPNTWRVRSHVNGEVYVDYTKPDGPIPFDVIGGQKYVKLSQVKKSIKNTLDDPSSSFRHDRDRDALNRIKIYEKLKRK